MSRKFIIVVVCAVLVGGCGPEAARRLEVCADAGSAAEVISSINKQQQNATAFRVNSGRCLWVQKQQGRTKSKESFNVKLWVNPPVEIYMQADIALNPKGLVLGANEAEYWLAIKPKEVSGYWWGRWGEDGGLGELRISPKILLEAFGMVEIAAEGQYILSSQGQFDVLTEPQAGGGVKKVYVSNCTERVRKIEYLDMDGQRIVAAEMDRYRQVTDNFAVPTKIKIVSGGGQRAEDRFTISIGAVRDTEFGAKLKDKLFSRPSTKGFEHIYRIIDGQAIEQVSDK